ncbi:Remorin_C domain-containing protein [Cephalotus follicularis]|uniref:Remorin_C domain-containing protein n=1 Tax=Cephalotus follicularis TaxID=3775 RepID=A0A1Q3CUU9_CEPFO|nr:Remorin_C domain-containing protein [Cephalotus follicularis]
MEYERIEKVQTGIISPSKLRMKLIGPHNKKKDGSNNNSSRTSPSRLEDSEFVNNSLLASNDGDLDEEAPSLEVVQVKASNEAVLDFSRGDQASCLTAGSFPRDNSDASGVKLQHFVKADNHNSIAIHPMRIYEDENLDYDSNASTSSFEFHKGDRSAHSHITKSFSKSMPSKWNDAEKWIMNRQNVQPHYSKKNALHNQTNRLPVTNMVRVVPDSTIYDHKSSIARITDTKRIDYCQSASQMALEKFSFVPSGTRSILGQAHGETALTEPSPQSKDLKELAPKELSCTTSSAEDATVVPVIRSVCMRDMGTEMTPATSQEPSRTATPVGATTPIRSPTSSIPSSPRRGAPAPTPMEHTTDDESGAVENTKKELSEQELKLKTRREIVALGVQLGKMNIAEWASKDEQKTSTSSVDTTGMEERKRIEYEKCAAAWEEAEKTKHTARLKREQIKIQAWESRQKAKLEAEMRKIEAKVEQMRAQSQAKMVKKLAMTRQSSDEKRAAAEARKNRDAERTAAQADYIRETGRIPSSNYTCCGWSS